MTTAAIVLGALVAIVVVFAGSSTRSQRDPSMMWEARFAGLLGGAVVAGPLWLAQLVVTVIASVSDGPIWLWMWWIGAPFAGIVLASVLSPTPPTPKSVGAVAVETMEEAWARFEATPDWELRSTPALPSAWPPLGDGVTVWYGYAERPLSPGVVEVSRPWARSILGPTDSIPSLDLLTDVVVPLGPSAIVPLTPAEVDRPGPGSSIEKIRRGESVEQALRDWRRRNGTVAHERTIAAHLPDPDRT